MMKCLGGSVSRRQSNRKAEARSGNLVDRGRFLNKSTHKVVNQQVHEELPLGGLRTATAEVFHLEGRLQRSQA